MKEFTSRSSHYQYIICEITCSQEFLSNFTNSSSLLAHLNPFEYNEEILLLEDKLKERLYEMVNTQLSQRQKDVFYLTADGYTQMEIAKILDVNQSSVNKCINGNCDYSSKKVRKRTYGGFVKKLKKLISEDPQMQEILNKIMELREERL